MSIEWYDLNELMRVGNPWHGAIQGATLITGAGSVSVAVVGDALSTPDTSLVEFFGLPVPVNSPEELELGHELKNYAVLFDKTRRYSPKSAGSFGVLTHVYLTDDRTHYHVDVVATNISGSIGAGDAWNLSFRLDVKKAESGTLGSTQIIIPEQYLAITGIGSSAGCYAQLSNFSPDGKKLVICIHKFANSAAAATRDARRSLGVAGVWEVVLSGGSKTVAPTAVLSLVKNTAACNLVTDGSPVEYVADLTYSVTGSGESAVTPLPSPPNPAGLVTLTMWQDWTINLGMGSYISSRVDYRVIGAAYSAANTLCIFALEVETITSTTDEYTGPADGETVRLEADVKAYASDHSIVTEVFSHTSIPVRIYVTWTSTTRYRIKSGAETLYEVVKTVDATGVDGHGAGKDSYLEMFLTHSPPFYLWQTLGGAPVYNFNGETVTEFPTVSARMTSNNTAAIFCNSEAYSIFSVAAIIGGRQTLPLDSNSLPWCAWHPKTGALATTPGYSWC